MAKAKWYDHLWAWADPYVAINKNGDLVHAKGYFDSGNSDSTLLSDKALAAAYEGLYNPFFGIGGSYDNVMSEYAERDSSNPSLNPYNVTSYSALDANPIWKSLDTPQKQAIIDSYGESASPELLLKHLNEVTSIGDFDLTAPTLNYDPTKIASEVDAYLAQPYADARSRLNSEEAALTKSYEDQLQTSADMYNRKASGLLSNQYLANAQTYDALQSDMRKSRQNALEAGASAGIRLAGNVNALLTAQNKQSQTAMDTSNALAEMLLQQRNAAAGIRSDYRGYMSDLNQRRTDLDARQRSERQGLINDKTDQAYRQYEADTTNYNNALTDWENKFDTNVSVGNKFAPYAQNYYRTH